MGSGSGLVSCMLAMCSKWNTPLQISLEPSQSTVIGRLPASSYKCHRVILHSEKLPYMLSREHAELTYNNQDKKWMLKDLEVKS